MVVLMVKKGWLQASADGLEWMDIMPVTEGAFAYVMELSYDCDAP